MTQQDELLGGGIPGRDARTGSDESMAQWLEAPQVRKLMVLALACFALLTCVWGLHYGPPLGDHECINAQAARNAIQSGEWLIPKLGDVARIRKTPLGIWLIGLSSWLAAEEGALPVTQWSARLPSAVAAFATVWVVYAMGRMLYGRGVGIVAGFLWAGCAATVMFARNAQVDIALTLFSTLAMAFFWAGATGGPRVCMALFYVAFALAMMAKAPLPLATIGLSLALYWFITLPIMKRADSGGVLAALRQQISNVRRLWLLPGIVVFLLIAGAWPAYVTFAQSDAWSLWKQEYLDRFTGELTERERAWWYYISILFGMTFPYMLSLPEAAISPFLKKYRQIREGQVFVFTWALVGTIFLSTAAFKRPHYILSVLPAYILTLAPVVHHLFFGDVNIRRNVVQWLCRLIPVLLVAGGIGGGVAVYDRYPGLLVSYIMSMAAATALWGLACRFYARVERVLSFAFLQTGIAALLIVIWPAIGRHVNLNAEVEALAAKLKVEAVQQDPRIIWVDGRPDASIEFYSGLKIERLISELEMSELRPSRKTMTTEVLATAADRIDNALEQQEPVFLVLKAKSYELLQSSTDLKARVVARLSGFHADQEDDLMIITQAPNESEEMNRQDSENLPTQAQPPPEQE